MLIAQISDIHAAPDNDHLQRFGRVLSWLDQVSPDVLVLTGDLTDGFWSEGYKKIAARLNAQRYPSLLLPGNSDDGGLMRHTWGNERWARDAPEEFLHFNHDADGLRLIGLDSTVREKSYGSVSGRLEWLEKHLSAAGDVPMLLFLHHHVFTSGIPTLDETMCRGLSELEALIKGNAGKIVAISSGHVHRPVAGTFADIQANICGSVCPANPVWFGSNNVPPVQEPPMLMLHRYEEGELSSHHVCIG